MCSYLFNPHAQNTCISEPASYVGSTLPCLLRSAAPPESSLCVNLHVQHAYQYIKARTIKPINCRYINNFLSYTNHILYDACIIVTQSFLDKMAMFCKLPNPRTTLTLQTLISVCAACALPSSSALTVNILYKEYVTKGPVGSDELDGPDTKSCPPSVDSEAVLKSDQAPL